MLSSEQALRVLTVYDKTINRALSDRVRTKLNFRVLFCSYSSSSGDIDALH